MLTAAGRTTLLLLLACGCNAQPSGGDGAKQAAEQAPAEENVAKPLERETVSSAPSSAPLAAPERKPAQASRKDSPPNIVMVLIDTLRPDFLGFMGANTELAPFLAEIAEGAAVFDHALSTSSWTAPSTASLFTSLYPPQHTVVQGFKAHRGILAKLEDGEDAAMTVNHIPAGVLTMPELLKGAGYRTFGLAANINIGKEIGFDTGFDTFEKNVRASAAEMFETVSGWQSEIVDTTPFFLYLHFNDAHMPYNRREEHFTAAATSEGDPEARYRSEIGYLDAHLRKLWSLPGLAENTVLIVVSDHGEEFGEHGGTAHGPTLYTELNRILLMVHGPAFGIKPRRVKENVSLIDVLPTVAELAGTTPPSSFEGTSLLPVLKGKLNAAALKKRLRARHLFAHRMFSSVRNAAVWSVTHRHWKLIDYFEDRAKLFDHRRDPTEQDNLVEREKKMASTLYKKLRRFKKRVADDDPIEEQVRVEMDEQLYERLRQLGYISD